MKSLYLRTKLFKFWSYQSVKLENTIEEWLFHAYISVITLPNIELINPVSDQIWTVIDLMNISKPNLKLELLQFGLEPFTWYTNNTAS